VGANSIECETGSLRYFGQIIFIHINRTFFVASATYQVSLFAPWFVVWRNVVELK